MMRHGPAVPACILTLALSGALAAQADLKLRPKSVGDGVAAAEILATGNAIWRGAPEFRLHLNRTPPLYASGPKDDGARPTATVRLLRRNNGETFVRLRWTDASVEQAKAGIRLPDAGAESIYKQHSQGAGEFADAACVMLPQQRGPAALDPSITMGDKTNPVDLYYWRAGAGFQVLRAAGLSTVADTKATGAGGATRANDGWVVVFSVGRAPVGTPITFAIWDGVKQHRDGIKYFSLWCEVD